jgi:hypothetical protein
MKYILVVMLFQPLPNTAPNIFIHHKSAEYKTELDCHLHGMIALDQARRISNLKNTDYICIQTNDN